MLQFDRVTLDSETETLRRQRVRDFVADNQHHMPQPNSDFVTGHDPEFSAKLRSAGLDRHDLAQRVWWRRAEQF